MTVKPHKIANKSAHFNVNKFAAKIAAGGVFQSGKNAHIANPLQCTYISASAASMSACLSAVKSIFFDVGQKIPHFGERGLMT